MNFRNSGMISSNTATASIVAEIGLDTRIPRSPCDIISDWRNKVWTLMRYSRKLQAN